MNRKAELLKLPLLMNDAVFSRSFVSLSLLKLITDFY